MATKKSTKKPVDLVSNPEPTEKIIGEVPPKKAGVTKNGQPQKIVVKEINGQKFNVVEKPENPNINKEESKMAENKNPETKNPETTATNPAPEQPQTEPTQESVQIVRHIHEPRGPQPWDEFGIDTIQLCLKAGAIALVVTGVTFGMAALCGQTESK